MARTEVARTVAIQKSRCADVAAPFDWPDLKQAACSACETCDACVRLLSDEAQRGDTLILYRDENGTESVELVKKEAEDGKD